MALEACFSANRFPDPMEDACELCLDRVVVANFQQRNCNTVTDAVCDGIAACNCGNDICVQEINTYLACEINDERAEIPALASCPATTLSCGAGSGTGTASATVPAATTNIPAPAPAPTGSGAIPMMPTTTSTTTIASTNTMNAFSRECEMESEALGSCFESNGITEATEATCESCLEAAILEKFFMGTCSAIYDGVKNEIRTCVCPSGICQREMDIYVKCEVEKERRENGLRDCLSEATSISLTLSPEDTEPIPSGSSPSESISTANIMPPVPAPTPTIMATNTFSAECELESRALGSCFESNGISERTEAVCESCVEVVIMSYYTTSCSTVFDYVNDGMAICTCPAGICQGEMTTYTKCEIEKERREEGLVACHNHAITTTVLKSPLLEFEEQNEVDAAMANSGAAGVSKNGWLVAFATLFLSSWTFVACFH